MTENLPTKFNPQEVEAGRYQKWLDQDLFKPSEDQQAKPYSIVIPPPKCNWEVASRSCVGYDVARYDHSSETDARL